MQKSLKVKDVRNILLSDKIAARLSSSETDQPVVDCFLKKKKDYQKKSRVESTSSKSIYSHHSYSPRRETSKRE